MKPFADSCEQNKDPILAVLREVLADRHHVLEIGSGTGQHAVHFGRHLPHLIWQSSDVADNHPGIRAWLDEAQLDNVRAPLELDVGRQPWPAVADIDAVFSANAVHIMSWPEVEHFFQGIGDILEEGGLLLLYGPFNYGGQYTSESNARFDQWLKARDPASGIRNFEELDQLARAQGMTLEADYEMPANNRILVWRKQRRQA